MSDSYPSNSMLFGLAVDDVGVARRRLEALLGIEMVADARGGAFWYGDDFAHIIVEANRDKDADGAYFRWPRHAEFPLILQVWDVADQDAHEKAILGDAGLRARRLSRAAYREAPEGGALVERIGPVGEKTVEHHGRPTQGNTGKPDA